MKKTISEELFTDLYNKMSKKIEESTETIFSGVDLSQHCNTNYERFMESTYSKQFFQETSTYEKNKLIKLFIENEVLSVIYTQAYDKLVSESTDGHLSFKEQYLLENSQEEFKLKYLGDSTHEVEQFEEGLIPLAVTGGLLGAGIGLAPAAAFGALTFLGMNLLLPSRVAQQADALIEFSLGSIVKTIFGTKSLLAMGKTSLSASNDNIINFDNIDINPEVRALFMKLAKSTDKKAPIEGINTIVASCIERNKVLDAVDINAQNRHYLFGLYTPKYNSIFTVFFNSVFKKAGRKEDEQFGTLIAYRKCLSEKLVDIYKFLMIANISQNKDYKKIIKVMRKGFHENPEQLLTFMHVETAEEQLNKDNIMTLVKFRLFLEDTVKNLKLGTFDVDRESSIFLGQKLKTVDHEIEDYLSRNQRQIDTVFETRKEFHGKDYKYNPIPEKDMKRKLFGLSDSVR